MATLLYALEIVCVEIVTLFPAATAADDAHVTRTARLWCPRTHWCPLTAAVEQLIREVAQRWTAEVCLWCCGVSDAAVGGI